jgi:serine peptidase DegS
MNRAWKVSLFVAQSAVLGLALAFVIVVLEPSLIGRSATGPAGPVTSYAEAVSASSPAVANVFAEHAGTGRGALGSAVVMDRAGYLVTNWHVIRDAAQIRVQLADGRVATPTLVGSDPDTELALLKVDLPNLPSIRLGRSDKLEIGEVVLAIGNSLGLSQTVTMGIVSATGRGQLGVTTFEDFIQTDAAINVGNSGGALVNASGELVGINTAVISSAARSRTPPEGIGFAIPVNLVRGVMDQLIEHGRVIRGYLGILDFVELPDEETAPLGIEGGAIRLLATDGPAAAAGLQAGDLLTHLDGQRVFTQQQAMNLVASTQPGTAMPITVVRPDGTRVTTTAVLEEREPRPGS